MANRNVRIVKKQGTKPNTQHFPKTASTAFDNNSLVKFSGGFVAPSADNDIIVLGIIRKEIAATDDDYALTTNVPVDIIMPGDLIEIDADKAATVGEDYGISNAYEIDVDDTTNIVMTVFKVISSTRVQGVFKSVTGRGVLN